MVAEETSQGRNLLEWSLRKPAREEGKKFTGVVADTDQGSNF